MHECHPAEQLGRQLFLEELYHAAGRDKPEHPMHCLYTGLWQDWNQGEAK